MSSIKSPASVYRCWNVNVQSKEIDYVNSRQFQSFKRNKLPCKVYSERISNGSDRYQRIEWCFIMNFLKQNAYEYVHIDLFCTKLPYEEELKSGAKGSMEVKDADSHEVVVRGSCESVITSGYPVCETPLLLLDYLPESVYVFADLQVSRWKVFIPRSSDKATSTPDAPPTSLGPSLALLAADSQFTDVAIEAGGERISAHRNVLAARSPVLRAMLSADMQEGREARIVIEDASCAAWRAFQTFLYTDGLEASASGDTDLLLELLMLSDKYEVDPLKERVEAALVARMTKENVLEIFEAVEKFRVPKVKDAASQVIVRNWAALKKEKKIMAWMASGSELGTALFDKLRL